MFRWKFGQIAFNAEGGSGGGTTEPPASGATEHPVSAPWGAEGVWNIGEGDAAKPWWSALPDEVARKHVEAKQYANPAALALANYNLTRLQTNDPNVVDLPGAQADQAAWDAFYTKLGRPESADKYDLKFEGVTVDDNMVTFGKEMFHKMGLSNAKAQEAADMWNKFVADSNAATLQAQTQQNDADLTALQTRWGAELDANKADGKRAVEALGLSADIVGKIEANIGSAAIVELLATIGKKTREGGGIIVPPAQFDPNNPATMTKEQAAARITELQADATFQAKYADAKHPEHAAALKQMEQLFAKAY